MIPLNSLAKGLQKSVVENSPTILTALGVTGVLSTAFLSGKAAFRAADIIRAEEELTGVGETGWPLFKKRFFQTWVLYIPPASVGAVTIVCVIGANTIGGRRNAALVGAYALTEGAFKEYKLKVAEQIGENKERKVTESIIEDRMQSDPVSNKEVIITYTGDVLCYEAYSGRYFQSNMEAIRKAQNDVNFEINNNMYASLNDFYSALGLPRTDNGDDVGWNVDNKLDIRTITKMSDDNRPCIAIEYLARPKMRYDKNN